MTESYWQIKNRSGQIPRPSVDIPDRCDVAIIGGGLVGISAAYFLKALGCQNVVALEKRYVGYGASGRNAGFLLAGMAEPYSRLVVGMGRENARFLMRVTMENHRLVAKAIDALHIQCDYQNPGSYHLAISDVERRELIESVELQKEDGFPGEFIEPEHLRDQIGFGNYNGGYFYPDDGNLDPFAFVQGLSQGLRIVEEYAVNSIRKSGGMVEISDGRRPIKAEMAILATNAYSPLLDDFFAQMIFPVKGQMLAARTENRNPLGKRTYYANFGYDYFRQSPDHTILMGGLRNLFIDSEVGFYDALNPDLQKGLENYLKAQIGIGDFEVLARWTGVMGNTIDGLPLVGPLPHNNGVLAAVGCNGHGFGLGMIMARDVANAIMKGETSELLKKFSLKRFLR